MPAAWRSWEASRASSACAAVRSCRSSTRRSAPPDFGPYITNLERKVDGVILFTPGADGLRFARQYIEAGLKGKVPLMDIYGQATFEPNLPQLGDTGLGILSALHYTAAIKSAENERFVKAFRAKTGRLPTDNGPDGYVGARTIVEAANALGGNIEDARQVRGGDEAGEVPLAQGPDRLSTSTAT